MTTVGHTLFGLSVRNLTTPRHDAKFKAFIEISLFAAIANLPDWSFPGWGHNAYHVSHSIFILSLMMLGLAPAGIFLLRKYYPGGHAVLVWTGLSLTVLTHVFLDALYGMGSGIAMFWPASDFRLHLPVPWFRHLRPQDGITRYNVNVLAVEALFYGTILIFSILARRKFIPYISKKESPGKLECQP